jgi:hypothetical protein
MVLMMMPWCWWILVLLLICFFLLNSVGIDGDWWTMMVMVKEDEVFKINF